MPAAARGGVAAECMCVLGERVPMPGTKHAQISVREGNRKTEEGGHERTQWLVQESAKGSCA